MCVVSRVLYGELHARTYDIIEEYKESYTNTYTPMHVDTSTKTTPISKPKQPQSLLKRGSSWLSNILHFESFSSVSTVESDIIDANHKILPDGSKLCKQHTPKAFIASDVKILFPHVGNIHEFTAGEEGAAMLDILLPPYECEQDRDCIFYRQEPFHSYSISSVDKDASGIDEDDEYCWLLPIPQPPDFQCTSGSYLNYGEINTQ